MKPFETIACAAWLGLAATAAAMGAGWIAPSGLDSVTLCLFRAVTGLPCPGCGMGHALIAAFRGNWAASFRLHPLGVPFLLVWTGWLCRVVVARLRHRALEPLLSAPLRGFAEVLALAAVVVAYVLRIAG